MIETPGFTADETLGEVVIENYQNGVIFDLPLLGGYRYDSQQALYAPYWLPDSGTDGTVTLFNITGQSIMVTPSITAQGVEQSGEPFSLGPFQSLQMSLKALMGQLSVSPVSEGFLTLRYTGPPHALDPALLLANPSNGFSLVPGFNARLQSAGTAQTNWQFPAVFLEGDSTLGFAPNQTLTAYALISNGTNAALSPQVNAYETEPGARAESAVPLPVKPLAPLETQLINLSAMANSGGLTGGGSRFALSVEHGGSPGTLAVTVFSVGPTGDFVLPADGTVHPSGVMDSSYWDISGGLEAMLAVYNPGPATVQATATLTYQTSDGVGAYTMPSIRLLPYASQAVNLNQLVASGAPDANGNTIPPGTTFGTLTLQAEGGPDNAGNSGLIIGGCATFDPKRGGYGNEVEPPCDGCNAAAGCEVCDPANSGNGECEPNCSDAGCCGIISVTFEQSNGTALSGTLRLGISAGSNNRTQQLRALVSPVDATGIVGLTYTSPSGGGAVSISNATADPSTGVIMFSIVGTTQSAKKGDVTLEAVNASSGAVLQTQPVSVVIPGGIAEPHDTTGGGVVIMNADLNINSTPPLPNVPAGTVNLDTLYVRMLTIKLVDQLGDPLGSVYAGAVVSEAFGSGFVSINSPVTSGGSYTDPVGVTPGIGSAPTGSAAAVAWLTSTARAPMPDAPAQTQNIAVQVDGFTLNPGVVNRQVVSTPPSSITITWP